MANPYKNCREWIWGYSHCDDVFGYNKMHFAFVWYSLKQNRWIYFDRYLYEGVAEDMIMFGEIQYYRNATYQGERCMQFRFSHLAYKPERIPFTRKEKLAVWAKYNYECNYCGRLYDLQIDHIRPVSKGGTNHPDNLQLLCRSCNMKKFNY